MEGSTNYEIDNVQAAEQELGQVNDQVKMVDAIVSEAVNQPSEEEEAQREQRRKELKALRILSTTEVPPEEPTLMVDEVGFFARNDIHAVKGKQKCGKTSMLKVCMAAWMNEKQFRVTSALKAPRVLFLDTEQKATDVKLIVTDVLQMTGLEPAYIDEHLAVYTLRRRNFDHLLDDMKLLISDFRPDVVIVDGIVEFVASFNDETMAKQLIHEELVICEDSNCAIVNVLHTNKADEDHNMRGHLGTMLAQKAGTVLECKKTDRIITVTCSDSRHAEMPDWSICFDEEGHLQNADEQRKLLGEQRKAAQEQHRKEVSEQKNKERLDTCLQIIRDNGGTISRKELTTLLEKRLDLKRPTVSTIVSEWVKKKALYEVDKVVHASPDMELPF